MTQPNYEELAIAIEHIAEGLERLAILSLDIKRQLDAQVEENSEAGVH